MKTELMKKLIPIIEGFVDEVLKSFGDVERIRKDAINDQRHYEDLCREKEKELAEAKKQKADYKAEHDRKITDLENARQDFNRKAQNYENLAHELKSEKKETDDKLAEARVDRIRAKDSLDRAEKAKEDLEALKKNFETKLELIKADSDKSEARARDLDEKEKKLRSWESNLFSEQTRNNHRANDLNDQELKIKAERKEIDRLVKRYKLEQQVKEA